VTHFVALVLADHVQNPVDKPARARIRNQKHSVDGGKQPALMLHAQGRALMLHAQRRAQGARARVTRQATELPVHTRQTQGGHHPIHSERTTHFFSSCADSAKACFSMRVASACTSWMMYLQDKVAEAVQPMPRSGHERTQEPSTKSDGSSTRQRKLGKATTQGQQTTE
jgi:hypothetical protein